ncbi:hypothetical protein [Asticcacaulis endophyticus]|uniref:Uncharacterized protein n=1 Tax=Asticcacaulis endophyticus TaxID=1395890 RepID=A0A918QHG4_9CAUL|nr:hypothetical protein [Asticcacaulis endophyticus]GGZ45726.1 hypothetical protein GCM10011273_35560 [Asticcacaulis endophyticus]
MADQVAALYARLEAFDEMNDIASSEWKKLCLAIANNAPKLASEITASMSPFYIKDKNGKFVEVYAAKMEGVLTKTYADIFSSKLGMALYREHVGEPLPLNGSVFSSHFFNVGASEEFISAVKEICPIVQTLSAGKFEVSGQFKYFLGTNHESLCVAYSQFRGNFSVFSVATSKPEILREALVSAGATELKPGELFSKMPNSK